MTFAVNQKVTEEQRMDSAFEDEIRKLLASGNKIAAIKRYREETGAGLVEAKAAVESLDAVDSFSQAVQPDNSDFTDQIVGLLGRGEKISAVKLYREQFGGGLNRQNTISRGN